MVNLGEKEKKKEKKKKEVTRGHNVVASYRLASPHLKNGEKRAKHAVEMSLLKVSVRNGLDV